MSLFKPQAIPTDVALRAFAICAIVHHHANMFNHGPLGLGGGMTFLLMLSGLNFARFALKESDPVRIRASVLELGRQVFIPSVALVILSFIAYREFDLLELLFVRNWRDTKHIAAFYNWYPQVLLQLLALLYLMYSSAWFAKTAVRFPVRTALALFAVGLLLRALGPFVWDTEPLRHHLPHTMLWNFMLGCAVYFLAIDPAKATPGMKALALACALSGAFVGWGPGRLDFWWLTIGTTVVVLMPRIWLPLVLARGVIVVSSATFMIFLTHLLGFKVLNNAYGYVTGTEDTFHPGVLVVLTLVLSMAAWLAGTAFLMAFRSSRLPPGRIRYAD